KAVDEPRPCGGGSLTAPARSRPGKHCHNFPHDRHFSCIRLVSGTLLGAGTDGRGPTSPPLSFGPEHAPKPWSTRLSGRPRLTGVEGVRHLGLLRGGKSNGNGW